MANIKSTYQATLYARNGSAVTVLYFNDVPARQYKKLMAALDTVAAATTHCHYVEVMAFTPRGLLFQRGSYTP